MQFTSDGGPPPRGRTHTTYSELVREVSGDPAPADRVLGRSSSEDDLTATTQNVRISTHEQHLDNVDLFRMNILKNGGSRSNPDVTRDSVSPQPFGADNSPPPPLPVRNKPLPTSGSHEHTVGSHDHIGGSHEHNPFDQADPFESGKDVSDPSDFYQVPHNNSLMVANGDDDVVPSEVQPVNEAVQSSSEMQSSDRVNTISTTSTVPSGYEESTLWINVDDELEYQSPVIPYHDHYDVPTKLNPNDQHDDDDPTNLNDQHDDDATKVNPNDQDDDEGEEYINPEMFGDHGNSDNMLVTTDELEMFLSSTSDSPSSNIIHSSSVDEYSFPTELLGLSTTPPRVTEMIPLPPRASSRVTETVLPLVVPPRGIPNQSRDQQLTHSRPLPPIPLATHPTYVPRQEPPLPARTTCTAKANSLGRTVSAVSTRQQPRYDRESWIMKYVQQGYSRDQVVRALAITQNDFNMASNILKEFVKMR